MGHLAPSREGQLAPCAHLLCVSDYLKQHFLLSMTIIQDFVFGVCLVIDTNY